MFIYSYMVRMALSAASAEHFNCISAEGKAGGEAPVMLEFGEMQNIRLLPSLPDPFWPEW